ncbi:MAG: tetratricopeptide repeat protein [Candidatus Marinimicrobia bacterium]|nr:tetratricopeptide repeat protein [Candidatus Neomarinimicrobiota bacterium]
MKRSRILTPILILVAAFAFFGCQSQELTSAKVYIQQKDYAKAEYNFLTALDIEPDNPEVPYLLAIEIYSNKNSGLADYAKAKKYYDETLKRDKTYLSDNMKQLREQLYGSCFNSAVTTYNKVIRNESVNRDADLAETLKYFALATELKPADPKASIQIARIHSELLNDNITAITKLDKAISKAPKNGDLKAEKARILAKDGRADEALIMFEEAFKASPENMGIGLRYAQFLFEQALYEKSADVYNRLILVEPGNKDLYFNLGLTYLRLDDIEASKDQFETVVALDPEDTQAIAMVGQVYFDLKDYTTAEIYFMQLLDIEPENPDYLKRLGVTLTQQGRVEEGLELYNRGKELEGGN